MKKYINVNLNSSKEEIQKLEVEKQARLAKFKIEKQIAERKIAIKKQKELVQIENAQKLQTATEELQSAKFALPFNYQKWQQAVNNVVAMEVLAANSDSTVERYEEDIELLEQLLKYLCCK